MAVKEESPDSKEPAWFKAWRESEEQRRAKYKQEHPMDETLLEQCLKDLLVENSAYAERREKFLQRHNEHLLKRCLDHDDSERAVAAYMLELYHHQTAGERADDSDWSVRAAILVTLAAPTTAFLTEWIVAVMANEVWYSPSLWFFIVWGCATVAFYLWSNKIMRLFKRRRAKK
jgi:hypothetical protein